MQRYAVLGQPVAHSRSPFIHARFAEQTGRALSYSALELAPAEFVERLRALHAEGWDGFNVTVPHKAAAAQASVALSARAHLAGAANTLIRLDQGWRGDNTDGEGLLRDLERLRLAPHGRRVLILGAGGAARGVLQPLLEAQPAELVLASRNPWKPEALAEQFQAVGRLRPATYYALKGDRYDLVVNASAAGHAGRMPLLPRGLLAPGAACYDMNYGSAHAVFRDWAHANGAGRVEDGLGMLVEQAASSFALWQGLRPDTGPVLAALRAMV